MALINIFFYNYFKCGTVLIGSDWGQVFIVTVSPGSC